MNGVLCFPFTSHDFIYARLEFWILLPPFIFFNNFTSLHYNQVYQIENIYQSNNLIIIKYSLYDMTVLLLIKNIFFIQLNKFISSLKKMRLQFRFSYHNIKIVFIDSIIFLIFLHFSIFISIIF